MRLYHIAAAMLFAVPALSACSPISPDRAIEITDPWIRAPGAMTGTNMGSPCAFYMAIQNRGNSTDTLLMVESDIAGIAQIHLTEVDANGVASMRHVDGLDIPAGSTVQLKPGSYHIMLMDMKRELTEGEMIKVVLIFEKAGRLRIEVPVKSP